MWRDDAYLLDMLLAARQALQFAGEISAETFRQSDLYQNAIVHALQTIGEAARHVSVEGREKHRAIDWPNIINMRHRLVHDYRNIKVDIVWSVVTTELVPLVEYLARVMPPEEPQT